METIPVGNIGHCFSDGDELINQPNKEMLPAILSAVKAHQKHAEHCLLSGVRSGNAVFIIKGYLHDIAASVLCETLALYELVEGTKDLLEDGAEYERFFDEAKAIINFASLHDDV